MNDVPPNHLPSDDIDRFYRRASALDPGRPSDRTRQAVLAHARKLAASNTRIATRPRRRERWWRAAVFGTLAAAALAGLLVLPQILTPHIAPRTPQATAQLSEPAGYPPGGTPPIAAAPPPAAAAPASPAVAKRSTAAPLAADTAGASAALRAQVGSPQGLRLAAENGDLKLLQRFVDQLTDINSRDDAGRTALLLAILHGQTKAVEFLLAHGANPNTADAEGVTPLSAAMAGKHSAIIRMLKHAGAQ